jgi:multimeric flavodoxin WrbA
VILVKILGISGSPRKGNTLELVEEALKAASEVAEVECKLITLRGKLSPCIDCDKCPVDPPRKYCAISDKMDDIYPLLVEADGIIIGAPVYFGTVNAQTKAFMDRCRPLGRAGALLRFKVGGAIAVGACRHAGQEKTISAIVDYYILSGIHPVGLQTTLQVGATGVAWRTGKIKDDSWFAEHINDTITPFDEARQLGRTVAVMSKVMKAGLEVVDAKEELSAWKMQD